VPIKEEMMGEREGERERERERALYCIPVLFFKGVAIRGGGMLRAKVGFSLV
jgi:hypothetical protein